MPLGRPIVAAAALTFALGCGPRPDIYPGDGDVSVVGTDGQDEDTHCGYEEWQVRPYDDGVSDCAAPREPHQWGIDEAADQQFLACLEYDLLMYVWQQLDFCRQNPDYLVDGCPPVSREDLRIFVESFVIGLISPGLVDGLIDRVLLQAFEDEMWPQPF